MAKHSLNELTIYAVDDPSTKKRTLHRKQLRDCFYKVHSMARKLQPQKEKRNLKAQDSTTLNNYKTINYTIESNGDAKPVYHENS